MAEYSLSEQQIQQYRTESHLVIPSAFGKDELGEIDQTIRDLTDLAIESGQADKSWSWSRNR